MKMGGARKGLVYRRAYSELNRWNAFCSNVHLTRGKSVGEYGELNLWNAFGSNTTWPMWCVAWGARLERCKSVGENGELNLWSAFCSNTRLGRCGANEHLADGVAYSVLLRLLCPLFWILAKPHTVPCLTQRIQRIADRRRWHLCRFHNLELAAQCNHSILILKKPISSAFRIFTTWLLFSTKNPRIITKMTYFETKRTTD